MIETPIVDSHVHLADPARFTYDWMANAPSLKRDVLPEHLTAVAAPYEIDRFVFVEVDVAQGEQVEEARWVETLAAKDPRLQGIVASLPVREHGLHAAQDGPGHAAEADVVQQQRQPPKHGVRAQAGDQAPFWRTLQWQRALEGAVRKLADIVTGAASAGHSLSLR